ncbi:TIGR04283 family arsenosugar biosynthesis glycosyltransferase [Meridianimarinicoccus sp. MJW13]|uniref:TIGR04283 family arsenosugar biosynthesis glycosyltransferase n=1 Tax=Meridianimarinicoccus sp. MJW13 TaxID=2720031 RepID=UPI00186968D0|nr:TIGR04283 family arsenosugar biosynthesis glycosyltransferase [Fluviibacterium sp. MJW13]
MRAPISVVIPTLNAADQLPDTLRHLMPGLGEGLIRELVITDGGSTDATQRLAAEAGTIWLDGPAGRGGQLRRGVAAASGDWLLVLHADTHLGDGWTQAVVAHLESCPDKAGYFQLGFRARGLAPRLVAGAANLRARLCDMPFGDQGLLISRALYQRVGGYPDIPLMEDVALARALKGHLRPLPAVALTGAERYRENGWIGQSVRNLWRRARFRHGADPADLARGYDPGRNNP